MKKLLIIAILIGITTSCNDFEGWNYDVKHPSTVSAGSLFTNAQKNLVTRMQSTSVNSNIMRLLAQHWTQTTYTDESNYDFTGRDIPGGFWNSIYRDALVDFKKASEIVTDDASLTASTKANQLAVISIMQAYAYSVLVDVFGNIPYTEALDVANNVTPAYDDAATIYTDLFAKLDSAIAQLNGGGSSFPTADLLYHGDPAKWVKFANTLKLRMALRLADSNPAVAATMASQAVASGVFTSSADNAAFPFESAPPNTNPIWVSLVQSGRSDYVVANTLVDVMTPLNDPRMSQYFDNNIMPYTGGIYGNNNSFAAYSHIGTKLHEPDLEGLILSYYETEFLLAEAAERSLVGVPADAEAHYNNGIEASILYWGGAAADATAYLAQPTVAYATAAGGWKQKIGTQKWIALYNRGFEAWTTWRLLDYPMLTPPAISGLPVPVRYPYPNDEPDRNGTNYDAASAAIGGDLMSTKLFWDVN